VPAAPAFTPCPRSTQVGEFEVAISGGIWVAAGAQVRLRRSAGDTLILTCLLKMSSKTITRYSPLAMWYTASIPANGPWVMVTASPG